MAIITAAGLSDLHNQRVFNKNGSTVTLKKISDTEWLLFGDLAEGDSEGFGARALEIGDPFGGGFYIGNITIAEGGSDDGEYAIIMGGPESEASLAWKGSHTFTIGTESYTNGMANTLAMQANDPVAHYAGMYCLEYNGGGFDDWYLPASYELNLAWANRSQLAALAMEPTRYWSSTQYSTTDARRQLFSSGYADFEHKSFPQSVRPVRRIPFNP